MAGCLSAARGTARLGDPPPIRDLGLLAAAMLVRSLFGGGVAEVDDRPFFKSFPTFLVCLALIFGYVLSWVLDLVGGPSETPRVDWAGVWDAPWIGLPPMTDEAAGVVGIHAPDFSLAFVLLVVPGVIALIAENAGHVKAIGEITRTDTDGLMGRALAAADSRATAAQRRALLLAPM